MIKIAWIWILANHDRLFWRGERGQIGANLAATMVQMIGNVKQLEGVFDRYVDAAFKAMWADQKNMSDADVVAGALQEAGLDGARLIARTQEPEVKERLLKNTEASVARGTFGSPTFFVGDEIFFGKDKLRDVEDEIVARK